MVELDRLRVSKLKCDSCGCRDKRVAILKHKHSDRKIGFSTICCNCGSIKTYMFRHNRKRWSGNLIDNNDFIDFMHGETEVCCMFCPIPEEYCPNKSCSLHGKGCCDDLTYNDIVEGNYPQTFERVLETDDSSERTSCELLKNIIPDETGKFI